MKARVKHTGEWITVNPCNDGFYDVENHCYYEQDELDFAPGFDWSTFRREAAKDLLPLATQMKDYRGFPEECVSLAIQLADELIKQLKKK